MSPSRAGVPGCQEPVVEQGWRGLNPTVGRIFMFELACPKLKYGGCGQE